MSMFIIIQQKIFFINMGNVIAAGPPPPPPLPPALVAEERSLENPGTVEDLHKKTKGNFEANTIILDSFLIPYIFLRCFSSQF